MLTIKVSSLPGENIIDGIREMCTFSANNNVVAEQDINGVHVWTYPHSVPETVFAAYKYAQENGKKYAIVNRQTIPRRDARSDGNEL